MEAASTARRGIVTTFVKAEAGRFQNGKIIAKGMVPGAIKPPLSLDWVYLEKGIVTDEEVHPINKIFSIIGGVATVVVGNDRIRVSRGDVVWVPPLAPHHFDTTGGEPLELTVTKWP